ncbi:adenylate/guanylate cyclase domain-containing protein [Terrimonas alba]|uniref:adenylate/guanylate cyclase domain-containing protein n=1 Tax=Terrimonas alba TaxID=3349636 RepID=UPI0035F2FC23
MAKISLKNIIGKKNSSADLLNSLIETTNAAIRIEDENGNFIAGNANAVDKFQQPIQPEGELLGWVKGDEKTELVASLLTLLAQKDLEKKKLGAEVLMLYQEVNMVFNFSDKLAQAIGPTAIAAITLEEAMHLVRSSSGLVVLWDESSRQLQLPAASGEELFNKEKTVEQANLMLKIGLSGQSDIMSDLSILKETGIIKPVVQSLMYAALKVKHRVMGAIILASDKAAQYAAADLKFLTTLALQSSSAIESALLYEKNIREAREKEEAMRRIYEVTGKFVPYEFIGSLGHTVITDVKLGDQVEKIVTVLFTDIRDYTALSEKMTPEETFNFVCSYNEYLGPLIRRHNGFINQYLGDAIMALFPGGADDALAAAIEIKKNIRQLNEKINSSTHHPIQIGIGMHTGPLIMGITGDKDRLDATTISDTVNTASRIESLTKYYKAGILLSDATLQQIKSPENFQLRWLGKVQVKGKLEPVGIYECFSGGADVEIIAKEKTLSFFNDGMQYYLNKSFASAIDCFQAILEKYPEDRTAAFFLDSAIKHLQTGVPENWAGVVEMVNK